MSYIGLPLCIKYSTLLNSVKYYRAKGLPATSANFGPFAGVGMAASFANNMQALGLTPLAPKEARCTFTRMGYASQVVHARIAFTPFCKVNTIKGPWPFLEYLQRVSTRPTTYFPQSLPIGIFDEKKSGNVQAQKAILPTGYRNMDDLVALVRDAVSVIVGDDVGANSQFAQYAFDSLAAVELSTSLGRSIGKEVPGTLIFDHPSIPDAAKYLHNLLDEDLPAGKMKDNEGLATLHIGSSNDAIQQGTLIKLSLAARLPGKPTVNAFNTDDITIVPYTR